MLIFRRLAWIYSGRKINGKFKVEEGTPFQFISNLLFISFDRFREIIIYHESSARSRTSQGGSPFAHWCSSQTPDHLTRRASGRVAVELCMACLVQLEGMGWLQQSTFHPCCRYDG